MLSNYICFQKLVNLQLLNSVFELFVPTVKVCAIAAIAKKTSKADKKDFLLSKNCFILLS